ncbi:hypothetical protein A3H03_00775 [Candidatus Kuenenbacteria bacterium RIFCSPLOWO2_12_FULL_42_13]|uniref:Uncharacterized protein n=2 Tax=Candidatus Kueneniibacteriota TaxID=1752740 RepID=A0A0G1B1X1_9BACT|nr:MAG: hypothetical protein UV02_C0043G0009 [Candidatus Kuenenbacteria bacterium GW2011_GWA2_42_15]OGG91983.1 MAG: hypothetical protein A3H03_00775 [Candidatus Kuenenbacteria bacterium RIFCSPLOWO2_12_FULL_42_13]
MPKEKIVQYSFVHSLGVLVYVSLVALIMQNGDKIFGKMATVVTVVAFLLMFVVSATVVGGLVLGKSITWYLDGDKKNAIKMLFYTVGWLFIWLAAAFGIMMVI